MLVSVIRVGRRGTNRSNVENYRCLLTEAIINTIAMHQIHIDLCTGTWFIIIPVNRHRYQNQYGHPYSFVIHFVMFLTRNTRKMQDIYVF